MPRNNCRCDQCQKYIGGDQSAWFSDPDKDLDFCSERCYSQWTSNNDIRNYRIGTDRIEEAIKEFENKGVPLEALQQIFYHKNLFKEGTKKCKINSCQCVVKFSEKNYCPYHDNQEQELKSLVRQRTNVNGTIQEVERFKTWWSNENIATIITLNNSNYWVFLGIIDRKPNNTGRVEDNEIFIFPTNPTCSNWGEHSRKQHNYLSEAQSEAQWLRNNLVSGSNPILLMINPNDNNYISKIISCSSPYVIERKISPYIDNPDRYLSSFDIIKRAMKNSKFFHFAIYLGKNQVVHFYNPESGSSISASSGNKIRRDSWTEFLRQNPSGKEITAYSIIIPFKKKDEIIRHIAKTIKGNYNSYCPYDNNCEHFVNRCIYGYNYSGQSTPLVESGKDYTGFMTLETSSSRGIERLFLRESIRRDNERRDNERKQRTIR